MFHQDETFLEIHQFVVAFRQEHEIDPKDIQGFPGFDHENSVEGTLVFGVLSLKPAFNDQGELTASWKPLEDMATRLRVVEFIRREKLRVNRSAESVEA